jgi:hypothetical protein
MDAVFTFAVHFTTTRPVQPDQRTVWVTVLGEDSAHGARDAQWLALAMVGGSKPGGMNVEMLTGVELVGAEI